MVLKFTERSLCRGILFDRSHLHELVVVNQTLDVVFYGIEACCPFAINQEQVVTDNKGTVLVCFQPDLKRANQLPMRCDESFKTKWLIRK